jgi:hypothetical protein
MFRPVSLYQQTFLARLGTGASEEPEESAFGMKLPKAVPTALDGTVVIGPGSETLHMNRHPPQSLARIDSSADRG